LRQKRRVPAALSVRCICTDEPVGGGVVTALKSGPRTTCTTSPIPVARWICGSGSAGATVAAACSLPDEKNTVVDESELG
jgi:hypothetical protein